MKDYMKVKITEIACKFALRFKKFPGNHQKKGTSSAKHIRQSPCSPGFYATPKLQA